MATANYLKALVTPKTNSPSEVELFEQCFARLSQPSNAADTLEFLKSFVVPKTANDGMVQQLFARLRELSQAVGQTPLAAEHLMVLSNPNVSAAQEMSSPVANRLGPTRF